MAFMAPKAACLPKSETKEGIGNPLVAIFPGVIPLVTSSKLKSKPSETIPTVFLATSPATERPMLVAEPEGKQ